MENVALIESFSEFKDDKLIDRVTLMAILEDVLRNALKKKYGDDDNFDIIIKGFNTCLSNPNIIASVFFIFRCIYCFGLSQPSVHRIRGF
jgi:hypothetical protein